MRRHAVSALAFLVKNQVRPRGLGRLGLPCLLTGTGMAFPWSVIRGAKLASGNIVEDMQLGIDLALAGHPATFCEAARVTGQLPSRAKAALGQRTRWEHGHLRTLIGQVPRLAKSGLLGGRPRNLALAMELAVPPLSLLVAVLVLATLVMAIAHDLSGASRLPFFLLAGGLAALSLCILLAWVRFGRQTLPASALLAAPLYVVWKMPVYFTFLRRGQKEWVRTERDPLPGGEDDEPATPARPAAVKTS
jgi:cellulose synthase/poly-beta-1,6-N-acetylglucosamine synthase-like glycosyltransferase